MREKEKEEGKEEQENEKICTSRKREGKCSREERKGGLERKGAEGRNTEVGRGDDDKQLNCFQILESGGGG